MSACIFGGSSGRVSFGQAGAGKLDEEANEALGLNCPSLVRGRLGVLEGALADIGFRAGETPDPVLLVMALEEWRALEARRAAFSVVVVRVLERLLAELEISLASAGSDVCSPG